MLARGKVAKTLACIALRKCIAGTLVLGSLVLPPSAKADVVGDFRDELTDPLKLGKASNNILESVERMQLMLNQVGSLEATTNADLAERIRQAKVVVDNVIAAVDRAAKNLREIVTEAENSLASLERSIYLDAQRILDKVQCVAQNATDQAEEAVAKAAGALRESDPHITFLGFTIIDLKLNKVHITDPDRAYLSIRDGYLKTLETTLRPTDSAYTIISAYANIGRVAWKTRCAYPVNSPAQAFLLNQEFDYLRLAKSWESISPPQMK